jgi:GNAT superfamily N-acetyltransferase
MPSPDAEFDIRWCADPAAGAQLARFFVANADPAYISHGEIQDGRAIDGRHWSPALAEVMQADFDAACLAEPGPLRVAVVRASGSRECLALAMVEEVGNAYGRYAILHDFIVADSARGQGLGGRLLAWVEVELKASGIDRVFLESGIGNQSAHHFFEHKGYAVCSVNMLKTL